MGKRAVEMVVGEGSDGEREGFTKSGKVEGSNGIDAYSEAYKLERR